MMDKELIATINSWRKMLEEYVATVGIANANRNMVKMVVEDMTLYVGKLLEGSRDSSNDKNRGMKNVGVSIPLEPEEGNEWR